MRSHHHHHHSGTVTLSGSAAAWLLRNLSRGLRGVMEVTCQSVSRGRIGADGSHGWAPCVDAALAATHKAAGPWRPASWGSWSLLGTFPWGPAMPGTPQGLHVQPCSAQSCPPSPWRPLDEERDSALPLRAPSSNPLPALLSPGPPDLRQPFWAVS